MNEIDLKWSDPYRRDVFSGRVYGPAEAEGVTKRHNENMRFLFIAAGVILLLTTPFFTDMIPVPVPTVIAVFVLLSILASVSDMRLRSVAVLSLLVSVAAFFVFEFMAITSFADITKYNFKLIAWFTVNQFLAFLFFFAIHGSVRYFLIDKENQRL